MALVSYDYGSGSDAEITDDEEEVPSTSRVVLNGQPAPSNLVSAPIDSSTQPTSGLFSQLPLAKPITTSKIIEENDQLEDFIPTVKTLKEKKKVQITIPSLSEFDDLNSSDEPSTKRAKASQKSSGLLSLLPPVQSVPKSNITFVPDAVKKKSAPIVPRTVTKRKAIIPESAKKALAAKPIKTRTESDSDTDNEDFKMPDTFDDKMWEKVCGRPKSKKPIIEVVQTSKLEPEELTIAPDPEKPYDGLNNEAFKELIGKSKRPIGNIKLIDINEEEIMPDRDLWMTKSLTDPDLAPKPPEDDGTVDTTKKRKHHITFLAQQAKAKEQELKAAWATSRGNRMMSRAKYGF